MGDGGVWYPRDGTWLPNQLSAAPWPWGCQWEAVISRGSLCTLPMPWKGAPYLQEVAVRSCASYAQGREELGTSPPTTLGRAAQGEEQLVLYLPAIEKSVTPGNVTALLACARPHLNPPPSHSEPPTCSLLVQVFMSP